MANKEGSLQHSVHEHTLMWREIWKECSVSCGLCWSSFSGSAYCCDDCRFFLHESCASIEFPSQIQQHPSHPQHPLTLESPSTPSLYSYCCTSCSFSLDPVTAISTLPPVEEQPTEVAVSEIIKLLNHEHPFTSFDAKANLSISCKLCDLWIDRGTFYGCTGGCMFLLHKKCAEFPSQILEHPFHPEHALTFSMSKQPFKCEVCFNMKNDPGPSYCCDNCGICFHVLCAVWTTAASGNHGAEIVNTCHKSNLASCHVTNRNPKLRCDVCKDAVSGEVRYCFECHAFIHVPCLDELPKHLHLKLERPGRCDDDVELPSNCGGCKDVLPPMFRCESCGWEAAEIHHPAHQHPLALRSYTQIWSSKCKACEKKIDGLAYWCKVCKFKIHKSCAELPPMWQHPLHPAHPLLLNTAANKRFSCRLCYKKKKGYSFYCSECEFHLDIKCATKEPTFKHSRHEHSLVRLYTEPVIKQYSDLDPVYLLRYSRLLCNSCGASYPDDGEKLYGCLSCNFRLHDHCLLDLPQTIQHQCHPYHPLVLFDKFVDLSPDDLYCDYCEEIRHPDHGVYRCDECYYTVHIDCVIPPKLPDNPFLNDLDKKFSSLETKIWVMETKLKASEKELRVLEQERDIAEGKSCRMAHGFGLEGEKVNEDGDDDDIDQDDDPQESVPYFYS